MKFERVDVRADHFYQLVQPLDRGGCQERGSPHARRAGKTIMIWASVANKILPAFERATGMTLAPGMKLLMRVKPNLHAQFDPA